MVPPNANLCYMCAPLLGLTATSKAVACDGCGNHCDGSHHNPGLSRTTQTVTSWQHPAGNPVRWRPSYQPMAQSPANSTLIGQSPVFPVTSYAAASAQAAVGLTWHSPYIPAPIGGAQWPIQQWAPVPAAPRPTWKRGVRKIRSLTPPRRPPPPKTITLPRAEASSTAPTPLPIPYQSLTLLLNDINRLLLTPHEGREFDFRGTCAVVADRQDSGEEALKARVHHVAWGLLDRTVLAFDVHNLAVHASARAASGKGKEEECPCARCEHILTISVMLEEKKRAAGVSMVVGLRHFAN
ncbi:hypothetical protein B0H14DRAFT_2841900 [Mycena olivaceomarginata]|nr:hypothetical protein B0H14DRAFT_2841900 [Mycena olivaceomarginata]